MIIFPFPFILKFSPKMVSSEIIKVPVFVIILLIVTLYSSITPELAQLEFTVVFISINLPLSLFSLVR